MLPQTRTIRFNKANLLALPVDPNGKRIDYQDTEIKSLYLRVTPSGVKTFCVFKRVSGKLERVTIGRFPAVTVDQARGRATEIVASFFKGDNPAEVKRQLKGEKTFGGLFDMYIKDKSHRESTRTSYTTTVNKHLAHILPLKISEVTRDKLRGLKIKSDAQNNRVRAIISAVFNWANAEGHIDLDNPAKVIKSRSIESRTRFLQIDEVERFLDALKGNNLADFYLLCLLTGARKGNVQEMRWCDIDFTESVWTKPDTKNGDPHAVPLMPEAIQILENRKGIDKVWVFPGTGRTGHLAEPKKSWDRLRKDSGIADLNMHDLRRTVGSWQTRDGASLTMVGKTLGHKSLQASQVYARLDLEPVRESMDLALRHLRRGVTDDQRRNQRKPDPALPGEDQSNP